jgi:hypothetical protein
VGAARAAAAVRARALRWVAPLYPLLVTAVVVATGNHLWVDAAAGVAAATAGVALAVMPRTLPARWESRRAGGARTGSDVSTHPPAVGGDARSPARA